MRGSGRTARRSGLSGKVAVVTGAARGLGEGLARELSARGVRVALVGLEPERLARLAAELPGEAEHWSADVTDAPAMAEVAAAVSARFGRVHVVVANAGVAMSGLFDGSDEAQWRRVVEVNLLGSVTTCRAFLPALKDSRGYYLQIASLAAIAPAPLMSAYCASKSGVEAFAHCLRPELAMHGVDVGVAYLSWTDTDMVRGTEEEPGSAETRRRLPGPLGRVHPVAPVVARLADGIERRSAHVYAPAWLRATQGLRGALPPFIAAFAGRQVRRIADDLAAVTRRGLIGPGGAAAAGDTRARGVGEARTDDVGGPAQKR
ncbi:SDR family oxidoreductase [Streptomyces sp. B6B3]|uniref:SDR family oxidoreductase n=1 Tax=Streptomyces sp. B6B3 TaxID=3153570 RepID=UPI00325F5198